VSSVSEGLPSCMILRMGKNEIEIIVTKLIFEVSGRVDFASNEDLFACHILDSLSVMELLSKIETTFDLDFEYAVLSKKFIQSVDCLCDFIILQKNG